MRIEVNRVVLFPPRIFFPVYRKWHLLEDTVHGFLNLDHQEGFFAELDEHLDPPPGGFPELGERDQVDVAKDGANDEESRADPGDEPDEAHESSALAVLETLLGEEGQAKERTC